MTKDLGGGVVGFVGQKLQRNRGMHGCWGDKPLEPRIKLFFLSNIIDNLLAFFYNQSICNFHCTLLKPATKWTLTTLPHYPTPQWILIPLIGKITRWKEYNWGVNKIPFNSKNLNIWVWIQLSPLLFLSPILVGITTMRERGLDGGAIEL